MRQGVHKLGYYKDPQLGIISENYLFSTSNNLNGV
jgi:hypothetical protein